jgi:hypothetical protein
VRSVLIKTLPLSGSKPQDDLDKLLP